jgi:Undecaprenyl-phosphate galactose phosphotransferase WbaP
MLMVAIDIATLQIALMLGYAARQYLATSWPINLSIDHYISLSLGLTMLPLGQLLLGAYRVNAVDPIERFRRRLMATFAFFAVLLAWDYLVQSNGWSRGVLLGTFVAALALMPFAHATAQRLATALGLWSEPVVIFGAGPVGLHIARRLREAPDLGLTPVAFFDNDPERIGRRLDGIPVLGTIADSVTFERLAEVAIATVGERELSEGQLGGREDAFLRLPYTDVIFVSPHVTAPQSTMESLDLGGLVGLRVRNNLLLRSNRITKRALDLALTVPLLVLTAPVLALVAVAIKLASRGPVFYVQMRRGENGRSIRVLKLRTMHVDAEERLQALLRNDSEARAQWQEFFKLRNDPRIIPLVGHFLRRSSLDELPQLLNVLRGDMSLVGPRPFPDYHLQQFPSEFLALRQNVPPGITGLWQVSSRSDGNLSVQQALDLHYIKNWSLWLDFYILFRTVFVVLNGQGAR